MIKSVKTNTTVDSFNQRLSEAEIQHWFNVIQQIIFVIQYLSCQSLAFRGSSDVLYEHNNGHFLKAVEIIASFDAIMREHLQRIAPTSYKIV